MTLYISKEQEGNLVKWIELLRSGKYEQFNFGFANSRFNPTKFCCLAVAIKEFIPAAFQSCNNIPNKSIEILFGLMNYITYGEGESDSSDAVILASMNDNEKMNFNEIAEILEDYLFLVRFANHCEIHPVAADSQNEDGLWEALYG